MSGYSSHAGATFGSCTSTDWEVVDWRCNYSAFSGYHYTPSSYSGLRCRACGARWRTNAKYVDRLPHAARPASPVPNKGEGDRGDTQGGGVALPPGQAGAAQPSGKGQEQ
jgi:hypothetical protein